MPARKNYIFSEGKYLDSHSAPDRPGRYIAAM
jgi:hypothetical protein